MMVPVLLETVSPRASLLWPPLTAAARSLSVYVVRKCACPLPLNYCLCTRGSRSGLILRQHRVLWVGAGGRCIREIPDQLSCLSTHESASANDQQSRLICLTHMGKPPEAAGQTTGRQHVKFTVAVGQHLVWHRLSSRPLNSRSTKIEYALSTLAKVQEFNQPCTRQERMARCRWAPSMKRDTFALSGTTKASKA